MSGEPPSETPAPTKPVEPVEPNAEPSADAEQHDDERPGRFARLRKRLMEPRELSEDAKSLVSGMLDTSDRAKTELVRLAAREVRHYLEELKWKEDVMDLLRSHSLEVNASFHLKPLADALEDKTDDEPVGEEPEPEPDT